MIDCDVHNNWSSAEVLLPYLAPAFRENLERGELPGARGSFPHAHRPWLHPEDFKRTDAVPPSGETAGSDYEFMCEQLLDRYALYHACSPERRRSRSPHSPTRTMRKPWQAPYDDWLVETWLPRDRRLKGSLVVAPQDPEGAGARDPPLGWLSGHRAGTRLERLAATVRRFLLSSDLVPKAWRDKVMDGNARALNKLPALAGTLG